MSKHSVACIVLDGSKILIAKRLPLGQMGGRWEFPGGKVEEGETFANAVVREFYEEFSVSISVGELITEAEFSVAGKNGDTQGDKKFMLHAFRVYLENPDAPFSLSEHSETEWVTIAEIKNRAFVDSDLLLYDDIAAHIKKLGVSV